MTLSDQIREESYGLISEGESTNELFYLSDESQEDILNKLVTTGDQQTGYQSTDY